ncbi:polyadenylate-specific 3'-exoribonuclease AS [Corynebacterium ulceribovis]|uniref:polyadenylate-specific 3'-exoribonuclease AS n=1 Tax=Corynebacterium ulceribovis TaxID=487732 RepID=UPI0003759537|nr:polyadenylate-specific 3'-exoribonuclease AS [Corynebacterium ulceribovis]
MKYFYDTEFIEDGSTIDLISIGVVAEDGREFYAVSTEFDASRAGSWVRTHVLNQLPPISSPLWMDRRTIREQLTNFLAPTGQERPELWAWVGAYDHVAFAQLWGSMVKLPKCMPRWTHELKQHWVAAGKPPLPNAPGNAHDALADARHNLAKYRAIESARLQSMGNHGL